jgi:DNA adenine methylase
MTHAAASSEVPVSPSNVLDKSVSDSVLASRCAAQSTSIEPTRRVKPFVKAVGGKTQLLPELLKRVPASMGTYCEPFVGGGALFFALASAVPRRFERAVLADINFDLMSAFIAVRDELPQLIAYLKECRNEKDFFYRMRSTQPGENEDAWPHWRRGGRFIYLNKTAFNGLWRVNKKGEMNAPFGKYENPAILDEEKLYAAHYALQGTLLLSVDFAVVTSALKAGDFAYFDPPYVPKGGYATFTAYDKQGFGLEAQKGLAKEFERLETVGVKALLSNSDTVVAHMLYQKYPNFDGYKIEMVQARRAINSKGSARGKVGEILVRNWDVTA